MNPILEKLMEPFPPEAICERLGGGNRKFSYLETHSVINRLNNACAEGWSFKVLSLDWHQDILTATVELSIPGLGTRQHIGVQSVKANSGEDIAKGAISDGLKKVATLFGVGIFLYGENYEVYESYEETAPRIEERAVIPAGPVDKKQQWLDLRQRFSDLCAEMLHEDVSMFSDEEVCEFINGIIGDGYTCTGPRPSIGDYRRVITKMEGQR